MKTVTPQYIAMVRGPGQHFRAELYTFNLIGGGSLYYTDGDTGITFGGHFFSHVGPLFKRSTISQRIGVDVSSLEITAFPERSDHIGAIEWLTAVRIGILDGAEISVDRAVMATYGDLSAGLCNKFQGRISSIDFARSKMVITANSHTELLNTQMPRRLYQPQCVHSLFDLGCGLDRMSFDDFVTIGNGATLSSVPFADPGHPAGWFDQGSIVFTSGALNGFSRSIKQYSGGVASLMTPLPFVPALGDAATVYPGCDLSLATCSAKFNNVLANNRGFAGTPFVPEAETAI